MSKFQPGEPATTTKGYGLECVTSSNWFVVFRCITLHGAPSRQSVKIGSF